MKWSIALLLLLGVLAALCAGVLAMSLTARPQNSPGTVPNAAPTEVPYVVAARELEAWAVLDANDVEVRSALPASLPKDALSQPAQVIGKVLSVHLKAGEAFTPPCIAAGEFGVRVADLLRKGMRAVNLSLSDSAGIEGLLYPDCAVDVIGSLRYHDEDGLGDQQFTETVLENVKVLAVGELTVVKPESPEGRRDLIQQPRSTVTILVDSKQAERLHLARQIGTITVTLRNRTDTSTSEEGGTRLADLSPVFAHAEAVARAHAQAKLAQEQQTRIQEEQRRQLDLEKLRQDKVELDHKRELDQLDYEIKKRDSINKLEGTGDKTWDILILRGDTQEVRKFTLAKEAKK